MVEAEDDPAAGGHRDDELAAKLAQLSDKDRLYHQQLVDLRIDHNGEVTRQYQLELAGSLGKGLPNTQLKHEIHRLNHREDQRANLRDHQIEQQHVRRAQSAASTNQDPLQHPPEPVRDASSQPLPAALPRASMQGVQPSAQTRDYGELQRAHEQVAEKSKVGAQPTALTPIAQSAEPTPLILSHERLLEMTEHYATVRRDRSLPHSPGAMQEETKLASAQAADRRDFEQTSGALSARQQQEAHKLLDHQHFAEQVGLQAKWLAHDLKGLSSFGADKYGDDSRQAFQAARLTHEQRQNLGTEIDRLQDAARAGQNSEQDKHSRQQEAARGGKQLTSEERANISPETEQTMQVRERTDAAGEQIARANAPNADRSIGKAGNSRPGGRSR